MKALFQKTAAMQAFLNRPHGPLMRGVVGAVAASVALIATAQPPLAREIWQRFAILGDFKLGARRLSWYLRRGWIGLRMSRDQVFVFPHEMAVSDLAPLRMFLLSRQKRTDRASYLADMTYISGMDAASRAGTQGFAAALDTFANDADAMLDLLTQTRATGEAEDGNAQKPRFSIEDAEHALRDFHAAFDPAQVPWFVLSGTFLGLIRENGLLAHDYDIDLGVIAGDVDLNGFLRDLAAHPKFTLHAQEEQTSIEQAADGTWHALRRPVLVKVAHENGTHIDLFVHYREDDMIWHGSALFRWDNSDFALQPYDFLGVSVLAPIDADRYLTENYGTWQVPKREFHSAIDTTNQRVVANPLSVAIFMRRAWLAGITNPANTEALLAVIASAGYIARDAEGRYRFRRSSFGSGLNE